MNWGKIAKYAVSLLIAQMAIGFFESFFAPAGRAAGTALLFASSAASFLACGAIFARLAAGQPSKPLVHAWAALALQVSLASVLAWILSVWTGHEQLLLIALEWLVLVCALLVGTTVGSSHRRSTGQPADA
ncbi:MULTISPECIES: hypothetical protein [unclassified Lysobacter]|uniref:hypothetical protein n=1 Tax=unclassified Lysobacter TaxID=2635362 RepID=UPI0012FBD30E|nr:MULTISPECIES: hypothetical protein [unclassified Lysobacter]